MSATEAQIAMRSDPTTVEIERACAELLAAGKIKIVGEEWSDRTGRMRPVYDVVETPLSTFLKKFGEETGVGIGSIADDVLRSRKR